MIFMRRCIEVTYEDVHKTSIKIEGKMATMLGLKREKTRPVREGRITNCYTGEVTLIYRQLLIYLRSTAHCFFLTSSIRLFTACI